MKVREIMRTPVVRCFADTSLSEVARLMRDHNVGFLPVVDAQADRPVGVITDRDALLAAQRHEESLSVLRAHDAMATEIWSCTAEDDLAVLEKTMRRHCVRRLPVLDDAGSLVGVVSVQDVARAVVTEGPIHEGADVAGTLAAFSDRFAIAPAEPAR